MTESEMKAHDADEGTSKEDSYTGNQLETVKEEPTQMDTAENDATEKVESEASTSGKSSPVEMCLTKEMVEEEEKLEKKLLAEEEKVEEKMEQDLEKANEELREKRFQRLQFLLQKSNLYANYLLSRMTKQQDEEKQQEERRRKRIAAKLEKSRKERDHPTGNETGHGKNTRSRNTKPVENQQEKQTENESTALVEQPKKSPRSKESSPDSKSVAVRRSSRRSITPEPKADSDEKLTLRRSPRRSLTPEIPAEQKEEKPARRKSLRGSKTNSPAKSEGDSQDSMNKTGSRHSSRCSTPIVKEENEKPELENKGVRTPSGRAVRSRTSTPKVGRASTRSSRQSSRASSPVQDENKGGISAQAVADKLRKEKGCKPLQVVVENLNVKNEKTPGRKGRKRKVENMENYKISDYFTEAFARVKKAKQEQAEFEGRSTEEETDVSMETDRKQDVARENENVTQNVPEIKVTCEDEEKEKPDGEIKHEAVGKQGRVINGEKAPEEQPYLFSGGVLREYQMEGFKWLKIIYENGINGILADEMGLGKTIQCIALISHIVYRGVVGPFLVCAPLSTVPNWVSEFQRFAPKLPVMLYHGTKQERECLRNKLRKLKKVEGDIECHPIVVTSYEIVMNDRKYLQSYKWKFIIVDEGHRLKNFQCRLLRELKQYRSTHRLLLTGTPLQNNLSELWSLLNFLLPEIFDDLSSFEMWFDVRNLESANSNDEIVKNEQKSSILTMLHQILNPFMLRRVKSDVELGVPPKREVLVYAPLSAKQKEMYKAICDNTIRKLVGVEEEEHVPEIDIKGRPKRNARKLMNYDQLCSIVASDNESSESDEDENDARFDKWANLAVNTGGFAENFTSVKQDTIRSSQVNIQLKNLMMITRKCTNHPYLIDYPLTPTGQYKVDEDLVDCSGKLKLLDKMLLAMKERGHKVLLFSQMTQILDILQDYCYLRNFNYCRLDGSMRVDERKEQIESFNTDPEVFVFLLSTRAGGLGLNLTAADTVVIFDSDWNPQNDLQAQDRAHRIGQKKPVLVYRMVTAGTIDQKIVERAAAKRKLEKMIIHKGRFKDASMERMTAKLQPLKPDELLNLLKSVDYDDVIKEEENQVISKRDLNNLLDRSDLWARMKQRQDGKKEEDNNNNADTSEAEAKEMKDIESIVTSPSKKTKNVFKIVDEEQGDRLI